VCVCERERDKRLWNILMCYVNNLQNTPVVKTSPSRGSKLITCLVWCDTVLSTAEFVLVLKYPTFKNLSDLVLQLVL
jgi:hypothetical protein